MSSYQYELGGGQPTYFLGGYVGRTTQNFDP